MNLIEQLGGYECAKDIITQNIKDFEEAVDEVGIYHPSSGWIVHEDLVKELLEYRRQHNIYEVGDIVIVNGHESVYQIQYVYESACGYGMYQGRRFSHSMIERHATDAEIKAGKRLEVSQ